MQLIALNKHKRIGRTALSALAMCAVAANGALAHPHDDDKRKTARDKIVEKIVKDSRKQTVRIIQDAKRAELRSRGAHIEIMPHISQEIRLRHAGAIEEALDDVRDALAEVQERQKATKNKSDKKALELAAESLEKAIEALEEQKEMRQGAVTAFNIDIPGPDFDFSALSDRRLFLEFEREALEEALEGLDEQAEALIDSRQDMLEELAEAREELAEEISELQEEAEDGDDYHVARLRALRQAELSIAEMEEHHIAALKAAEKELKRTRKRLERQLKEKEERAKRAEKREKKREERREKEKRKD